MGGMANTGRSGTSSATPMGSISKPGNCGMSADAMQGRIIRRTVSNPEEAA